jgi:hypothetical protein
MLALLGHHCFISFMRLRASSRRFAALLVESMHDADARTKTPVLFDCPGGASVLEKNGFGRAQ